MIPKADRLHNVTEYYFSKKLREVAALRKQGKPIINMAIGSPDLPPPAAVVEALEHTARQKGAHQYQSYQGIPPLRSAMAAFYHQHYGLKLCPDSEVLPLMGSKEGIMHISMAFVNPGDSVLIPNPGYPTYASVTELVGAKALCYELRASNNWLPDLEALEKQDLSKVRLMWLNYPHMPTGAAASEEDFKALINFARRHKILLVNDNPYSFVLQDHPESILSVPGADGVAIELNSLSKTFNMAGWRVGMVAGNAQIIQAILQVKSNMDSGMFLGIQHGAIAALESPKSWFKELNATYARRRALVWKIMDRLQCTYAKNRGGLFVWGRLPEGKKAIPFSDALLYEKSVFITPGSIFGTMGESYIRASLCISEADLSEVENRLQTRNI
ncbi:MAG: aminotransferase class I/II-fold pyridoxal phosphate-dependent enzyme [Lutibacter sp.]|jgi:aspartate/methionine/tyrosine aminotransferase|nr:aminotransferase class I/II-fold pyridoxal phosphate-dependent enzyme [Lutibacter sp.]